jgi:hypothetical protein
VSRKPRGYLDISKAMQSRDMISDLKCPFGISTSYMPQYQGTDPRHSTANTGVLRRTKILVARGFMAASFPEDESSERDMSFHHINAGSITELFLLN